MRRLAAVLAVGCAVFAAQAATELSVDELIALHRAGLSQETILQYVDKYAICVPLAPDDLVAMADVGVPETLIQALVEKMAGCAEERRERVRRDRTYGAARFYYGPVCCPPLYGVYDPFFYDPFFFSVGFVFVHDPFFVHLHHHHHGFFPRHRGFFHHRHGVHPRRVGTRGPAVRTRPSPLAWGAGATRARGLSHSHSAHATRPRRH